MMGLHTFVKYVFDLALTVFWIWVPLFYFNLKDSPNAPVIWIVDIVTLSVIIFFLHRRGAHRIEP